MKNFISAEIYLLKNHIRARSKYLYPATESVRPLCNAFGFTDTNEMKLKIS